MNKIYLGDTNLNVLKLGSGDTVIYLGNEKIYPIDGPTPPSPVDYSTQYLTFVTEQGCRFSLSGNSVSYSLDSGATWVSLANKANSPYIDAGSKIMWKANLAGYYGVGTFSSTGKFSVEGNPMSLLYGDNFVGQTSVSTNDFYNLFKGATGLTSADNFVLNATTLADYCYANMFSGCTNLTSSPELPATTLTLACYYQMFYGCTSLTVAPALPSTTIAQSCYESMFRGCTSLTTAPELPATTLVYGCYSNMFRGCTNLSYIKALFTTTPSSTYTGSWVDGVAANGTFVKSSSASWTTTGVNGIPSGWTVQNDGTDYSIKYLTFRAEESGTFKLSGNTVQYSLDSGSTWTSLQSNTNSPTVAAGDTIMWKGSLTPTSGNGIGTFSSTVNFTVEGNPMSLLYGDNFIGVTDLTGNDWAFRYLFAQTKVTSAENMSLPATTLSKGCYNAMFQASSGLTIGPELPATTLTESCYGVMFNGCTSLTTTPVLPAPILQKGCYASMFMGCTSLSSIKCLATDISANQCTFVWLSGVSATGTFTKAASMTGWGTGASAIPTNWTVQDAS